LLGGTIATSVFLDCFFDLRKGQERHPFLRLQKRYSGWPGCSDRSNAPSIFFLIYFLFIVFLIILGIKLLILF
jgi:hypothetical protein